MNGFLRFEIPYNYLLSVKIFLYRNEIVIIRNYNKHFLKQSYNNKHTS